MTTTEIITSELKTVLRRLKLSRILDVLPERLGPRRTAGLRLSISARISLSTSSRPGSVSWSMSAGPGRNGFRSGACAGIGIRTCCEACWNAGGIDADLC